MRRPNFKVFIYHDFNSLLFDTVKVWAANAQAAVKKAKANLEDRKRDPEKFTFCAREI